MTKFNFIAFFLLVLMGISTNAQDAAAIFKEASDLLITKNIELDIDLKETKKNGRITEKSFNVLIGKFDKQERIKTKILKPERAKGITISVTQYPDKIGLIEILTPANGKIRKLKATQKNIQLVGSGSLFSDYLSKNLADLSYKLLDETTIDGKKCYQIEIKDRIDTKKGKAIFFIQKEDSRILQIISFKNNDEKESTTKLSKYKALGNKIHPETIVTEENKKTTEIRVLNAKLKPALKPEDFVIKSSL